MADRGPDFRIRDATSSDAGPLAQLVNFAGEGLPLYLWEGMAGPGETGWNVGRSRAARGEGSFSFRNAVVADAGGKVAACLIGYAIPDEPEPIADDMPPMFVPLQELENLAPGTWYVNVLAAFPEFRGQGLGTRLLGVAEETARDAGCRGLSIIVADANTGARRLYKRCGYTEQATRPMVKERWNSEAENWVLLTKPLS